MKESEFWGRLEYRLEPEFAVTGEGRFDDYWCDGISPEEYFITGRRPRILGEAWVCKGQEEMSQWKFELFLPHRVNSRDQIDWDALLPPDDSTGWLSVDEERHLIRISLRGIR